MNKKIAQLIIIIAVFVFVLSSVPLSTAQNEDKKLTFFVTKHPGDTETFELNVTIPDSLVAYYTAKSHRLSTTDDFVKFVTPYALKPIADSLLGLYSNDEDFTNGVLQIVHQITYQATIPGEYPAETLVKGVGDCDLFCQIAASILQAGGINVALLLYEFPDASKNHMQIGVQLQNTPVKARGTISSITIEGENYYIAECTGGNWQSGWLVGECPIDYRNATTQVITLENSEKTSEGTVYASMETHQPSTLDLSLSSKTVFQDSKVTITGQINPASANGNVTIYFKVSNSEWVAIGSVLTGSDGKFQYQSSLKDMGLYYIQATWSGNSEFYGAKNQISIVVLPNVTSTVLGSLLAGVSVIAVFFLVFNFSRKKEKEATLPEPI
jgi:hypothetical protein